MFLISIIPIFFAFMLLFSSTNFGETQNLTKISEINIHQLLAQKIDNYLQTYVHRGDFSGAVLVAQKGTIIINKCYGYANYEHQVPNTPQTKFRIASITKLFTALAIMQLQEMGLLQVQDSLEKYIPDYPQGEKITLHHLLTHTSGILNYQNSGDATFYQSSQLSEIISCIKQWPLDFEPGTEYRYSSSGYIILTYIIEKVSGKTYEEFLQEYIFNVADTHNSGYDHPEKILKHRASGYEKKEGLITHVPYATMLIEQGSGGLYSSLEDMYKWSKALFSEKLVSKKTLDQIFALHVAMPDSSQRFHGYGWFIDEYHGKKFVEYSGCLRGFLSEFIKFIDDDITIIVLSNLEVAPMDNDPFIKICDELPAMVFDQCLR